MALDIIPRSGWNAREPEYRYLTNNPTPRVWVHHTGDDRQGASAVKAHQNYHMDIKGWSDIAYSFLIGDNGDTFEGRGFGVVGGHTKYDNSTSHAICLLGNFQDRRPTDASLSSLVVLAQYGRDRGYWVPTLGGHRDAPGAQTVCPGNYLYALLPQLRNRVQEDDMTPAEVQAAVGAALDSKARRVEGISDYETLVDYTYRYARSAATRPIPSAAQIANAVVAALPAGSVDGNVVKEAVKTALREGTGA